MCAFGGLSLIAGSLLGVQLKMSELLNTEAFFSSFSAHQRERKREQSIRQVPSSPYLLKRNEIRSSSLLTFFRLLHSFSLQQIPSNN